LEVADNNQFIKNRRKTMLRYKEIKNMLMAEIARMNSNDRLPSRHELCKKMDTAKATLDKAINELVVEGALYSRGGSGTYVAGGNDELPIHAGNWGVIVRDVTEGFYAKIVRGVENVAQSYGINVILCNSDSDFEKQEQYIKRLSHSGVSGIIVVPVVSSDTRQNYRLFNQLTDLKVPFVFCNSNIVDWATGSVVTSNGYYGGYIATKHLLEKGYRNIAYISDQKIRTSIDRYQGYITALMENGIKVNQNIITFEYQSRWQQCGYEVMKQFLVSEQLLDAVFCLNDKVAQGVYQAISEAGLKVSDDIGVMGYDNYDICEKLTPALTTVDFENLEVGIKAAELLYEQINKDNLAKFQFCLVQPELVVRDSCLGLKKVETSK
jgi:DNA-binding LacI/PurR family transcriptional regulator